MTPSAIDNRVVQMGFDNKEFESGVQTSVRSLDTLKKGLDFSSLTKGLNGFAGMTDGVRNISSGFSALGVIGFTALQNLTNMALEFGKSMITAAFGINSMKEGFGGYETKVNAVKTVMAGTGETIDSVTQSLNELNVYSDRTIYSFEDMTANISKFTNAGLSSKAAATAIQGISNVAAISGANTNEAARAMYNFGQAMQQGSVRLMDWKSIENANMATVGFKTELLNAAVAMGTLTKTSDGMYKTLKGTVISATKDFNTTLEQEWLTTKVLTKTLEDYASETTEIGKKANAAAKEVATFSQMMATIKDSIKTGWIKSWEIVFGDLNEARALYTEINNIFGSIFNNASTARNTLLQSWKAFGGRSATIDALRNSFNAVLALIKPIQDAFTAIFPPATGYQIASITWAIKKFTETLTISSGTAYLLNRIFTALFATVKYLSGAIGRDLSNAFGKIFGGMQIASGTGEKVLIFFAIFTEKIAAIARSMFYEFGFIGYFIDHIFPEYFPGLVAVFANLNKAFQDFLVKIKPAFSKLKNVFSQKIDTSGFDDFTQKAGNRLGPITTIFQTAGKVLDWFGQLLVKLMPGFAKLAEVGGKAFAGLGAAILKSLDNINYENVFDVLNGGLLSALLIAVRKFIDKGSSSFSGISGILKGVQGSLESWQKSLQAKTLMTIATAIGILAVSLIALSLVDSKKLTMALTGITVMFTELMTSMNMLSNAKGGGTGAAQASAQLLTISAAILVLSLAVTNLARLEPDKLMQGLIGVGVILAELVAFMKVMNLGGSSAIQITGIMGLSVALLVLSVSVKRFGEMNPQKMQQGLVAIGVLLTELGVFVKMTGNTKGVITTAISLGILGGAMILFSVAIERLGSLSLEQLAKGIGSMGVSLLIIAGAMQLMPKNMLVNAVALVGVAAAMVIMSKALKTMGGMSWEEIARGLVLLGGAMLIIVVGLNAMTSALPGAAAMLVMAAAMAIFTPALKALGEMQLTEIGTALLALAGVFVVIGLAGLILGPLTPVLLALSGAMVLFGLACLAVGVGVLAFSAGLAALAVSGTAGAAAIALIVTTLMGLIPQIAIQLAEGIISFAQTIAKGAPVLAKALTETIRVLIVTMTSLIPDFVEAALKLLTSLLEALAKELPKIIQAGMDIVLAVLKGISDNVGKLVAGAIKIVTEFLLALGRELPKIVDAGYQMIISLLNGLSDAIDKNSQPLTDAGIRIAKAIINAVVSFISTSAGAIRDALGKLVQQAIDGFWAAITGATKKSGNSPDDPGVNIVNSLADGMQANMGAIKSVGTRTGKTFVESFTAAVSKVTDALDTNLNLSPTIRPVVDLSSIKASGKTIDDVFGNATLNLEGTNARLSAVSASLSNKVGTPGSVVSKDVKAGSEISFTQINHSPVALSRLEIYRQTRNQLSSLKGLTV